MMLLKCWGVCKRKSLDFSDGRLVVAHAVAGHAPVAAAACLRHTVLQGAQLTSCRTGTCASHLVQSCQHQHACPAQLLSQSQLQATAQQLPVSTLSCCPHAHAQLLSAVLSRTPGMKRYKLPGRWPKTLRRQHPAAVCPSAPAQLQEKERESIGTQLISTAGNNKMRALLTGYCCVQPAQRPVMLSRNSGNIQRYTASLKS